MKIFNVERRSSPFDQVKGQSKDLLINLDDDDDGGDQPKTMGVEQQQKSLRGNEMMPFFVYGLN